MPRGFFTQSAVVLFERLPPFARLERALASHAPRRRRNRSPSWIGGAKELVVTFDAARKGSIVVDLVEDRWPDTMGDPETDPMLFGAWTLGAFGPLVYPKCLERACQQAVAFPGAAEVVARHEAFVRLRTTYVLGAGDDATVVPEDHAPLEELEAMVEIASRLLATKGGLAYFDPNAEVVLRPAEVWASRAAAKEQGLPPLDLYAHVRLYGLGGGFALMDSVGMDRFFLPDVEVAVAPDVDPNEAARFIRSLSLDHLERGSPIPDSHTVDGPRGRYRAHHRAQSLAEPPRRTVRFALEGAPVPDGFL